jgi:hypothetical protein
MVSCGLPGVTSTLRARIAMKSQDARYKCDPGLDPHGNSPPTALTCKAIRRIKFRTPAGAITAMGLSSPSIHVALPPATASSALRHVARPIIWLKR